MEGFTELESTIPLPPTKDIKRACVDIRVRAAKCNSDEEIANLKDEMMKTYPDIATRMPHLFNAVIDKSFPLELLDYMLKKSDNLQNDGKGIVEADTDVYNLLQQKYRN